MQKLEEKDLLAIHLHRSPDGSWYATGTFRDKTIGKNGQRILTDAISPDAAETIVCLIETGEPFRRGPSGKILLKVDPDLRMPEPRPGRHKRIKKNKDRP